MANRYIRNTVILAKIETTYGTDSVPTGGANALLVSNVNVNPLNANNVSRDLIRPFMGGSEQLVGTAYVEMSFDVELQGSGTLGTAPAWGPLLRASGWAETVTASTRVDYTPVSTAFEAVTIYWYDDGTLHKALGARGTWEIAAGVGERPVLKFRFIGLYSALSAASNPSATLTAWQTPLVVTDANSGDITLGCTYSLGAISGGTAYPSRGISINAGNDINHVPLLGGESVEISQRDITGHVDFDLTSAQEVTFQTNAIGNTVQTLGWLHGTASARKVLLFANNVQMINPTKQEINGKRLIGYDLRLTPSAAGNDDLRIVTSMA